MNQGYLINTKPLASAREVNAERRRRLREPYVRPVKADPPERKLFFVKDQSEFLMAGEKRYRIVWSGKCCQCGFRPAHLEEDPNKGYRVVCTQATCRESTPWFHRSDIAIKHWNMCSVLSR